ncbi:MAG: hypothetical protein NT130_03185 [Candidatus Micrarchaeota archaeon]|nr:hypothetical protein [Candidatus Micrarchaeota archaeon]
MKKGFILTAIATVLFVLLINVAFQYSKSSSAYSQRVSEMIVSEKVGYIFDDITEDITNITGLSITQQGYNLIFTDSFPGNGISDRLAYYEDFMRSYYLTPELEVTFLNPADQNISLNTLSSTITVEPFNMTYRYTDFAKTDLFIQIPYSQSAAINFIWYNMSVTTGNFTDLSKIKWDPKPKHCDLGDPGCIKVYIRVNDSINQEYISTTDFDAFDPAGNPGGHLNIDFSNESCKMEIWLGHYSGEDYLMNLRIFGCQVRSEMGFTFNSTNFWLDFPTKLKVRDLNYNTSKKDQINIIVTKLLK